ncbi:glycoside hydrolase family 31 protein [Aureibacter tunicatorum]|uniref:Alpha-glucosidase (Family GH31 glycosyl hydrolase) n=1 Tax=Aureibacter tunicatorum TaxID=866807 RepID=A0AAE4BQ44_9BACT|nr:TIM-barrel domain-containing protein [Aureibacter tunicatorum]MDR6238704.1 alpha-glucosidase (family GH31 glycosyl hydrolase) [Aureibacter tunicatorum]BDD05365.1 alpha-glucosidase [Aureibacter tunicatorum]
MNFRGKIVSIAMSILLTFAGWPVLGQQKSEWKDGSLRLDLENGEMKITPLSQEIFEVSFLPDGEVMRPSFAVIKERETDLNAVFQESDEEISIMTDGLSAVMDNEGAISFRWKGEELFSQDSYFLKNKEGNRGYKFAIDENEKIFGGGERSLAMDRRGHNLELYNKAHYSYEENSSLMNYGMPLVFSSDAYAIFFDNGAKGNIDIDSDNDNTLEFNAVGGRMVYYVIAEDHLSKVTNRLSELVGTQPMPARWTLGNIQSRFGYKTQDEVLDVATQMKESGYPLDGIIIDLFWFGPEVKNYMGELDWYEPNWPNPDLMIDSLESMGVKTVLITEPFFGIETKGFAEADSLGLLAKDSTGEKSGVFDMFFARSGLLDIFTPEAKDWVWEKYDAQIERGVGGWWTDLCEPEVHPEWIQHATGSADEMHNYYAHEWERMLFEKYEEKYPNERLFHINRSGYVGSARYGILPWSGDVARTWGGFRAQMPIMLTMSMSGIPYMSSDLGGFAGGQKDSELYARWLQFGAFNPIFRPHGGALDGIPSEPIFFDEKTQEVVKNYIDMRYRLMPYIYTMAWEQEVSGEPLVKPMFNVSNHEDMLENQSQYMWGESFLVAPVMESGQKYKDVFLPEGTDWIDYHNDKVYAGGQWITMPVDIDDIPVFVKGGSFIPTVNSYGNAGEYSSADLKVDFYPQGTKSSHYEMYEDDGKSALSRKNGEYELLSFNSEMIKGKRHITVARNVIGEYEGMPTDRILTLEIHALKNSPKYIRINGKKHKLNSDVLEWNEKKNSLTLKVDWKASEKMEIIL